ncbi:MAG: lytB 4 [Firmicutes bacterium]|nr:lytB 4 [Bacillota bacterium]
MRKNLVVVIGIILLSFIPVYAAAKPEQPLIRVGLLSGQNRVVLSAEDDFSLVETDNNIVLGHYRAHDKAAITMQNGKIVVNNKSTPAAEIKVVLDKDVPKQIEVNNKTYRGEVSIHLTVGKPGLTTVNTLPVEQYLYGVIPCEISPQWPKEAIKAQSVAARTYALYSLNKHKGDGYDVCAGTDCQVYGGMAAEDALCNAVIDSTTGEVMEYQEKLIPALFHCSSGGYTEDSENVWEGYYPFLRGVKDDDQNSPYYKWEKKFTISDFSRILEQAGYAIGNLQAVELSPLGQQGKGSADRGVSGRVKKVHLIGTSGSVWLSGNDMRRLFGLNSTMFTINLNLQLPLKKASTRKLQAEGAYVYFAGFGWGHGLGLSQWGAKAMAESAPLSAKEYYKIILKHYYTGISFIKEY